MSLVLVGGGRVIQHGRRRSMRRWKKPRGDIVTGWHGVRRRPVDSKRAVGSRLRHEENVERVQYMW